MYHKVSGNLCSYELSAQFTKITEAFKQDEYNSVEGRLSNRNGLTEITILMEYIHRESKKNKTKQTIKHRAANATLE